MLHLKPTFLIDAKESYILLRDHLTSKRCFVTLQGRMTADGERKYAGSYLLATEENLYEKAVLEGRLFALNHGIQDDVKWMDYYNNPVLCTDNPVALAFLPYDYSIPIDPQRDPFLQLPDEHQKYLMGLQEAAFHETVRYFYCEGDPGLRIDIPGLDSIYKKELMRTYIQKNGTGPFPKMKVLKEFGKVPFTIESDK